MEEWKNSFDPRYEISNNGNVRNKKTGRILKQSPNKHGYARVSFSNGLGKNPKIVFPHREVAILFIPNPDNKPEVNHKDGDKMNPSMENLEWVTSKENNIHARDIGLYNHGEMVKKGAAASRLITSKQTTVINSGTGIATTYSSKTDAAQALGISYTTLRRKIAKNEEIKGYLITENPVSLAVQSSVFIKR